jgi:hypothetical protein
MLPPQVFKLGTTPTENVHRLLSSKQKFHLTELLGRRMKPGRGMLATPQISLLQPENVPAPDWSRHVGVATETVFAARPPVARRSTLN